MTQATGFSSRWGLLLSVLGVAVGTGNIWRFPRIAARTGGDEGAGAFLLAWVVCLVLWSVPLLIAEYAFGRAARGGPVRAFAQILGPKMAWMGGFVALVAIAIMFYYSVVAGWCLYYAYAVIAHPLPTDVATARAMWETFQASGLPVVLHGVAFGLGTWAVARGVRSIEAVNRVLIPSLLVVVLLAALRTLTLEGSAPGIRYLFTPEWSQLGQPRLWLEALTQNAWDTGAGWGLVLTYAAYMRKHDHIVKNAWLTGLGNNTVSLLAAVTVFGTVFAVLGAELDRASILEVMRDSGPGSTGLTFMWMPQLFARMPAATLVAVVFFVALSAAAITSLLSMIELAVRVLVDFGMPRGKSVAIVGVVGFACGIPSALSLDLLGNQDFVWGVGLMLSGTFIALGIAKFGAARFRHAHVDIVAGDWIAGRTWVTAIRFGVPVLGVTLMVWWLYLSATEYAPDTWYDPTDPYSVMTCIVQWVVLLGLAYGVTRRYTTSMHASPGADTPPAAE